MKKKYILWLLVTVLFACEEKAEWEIVPGEPFLIADCIITNELKRHELYLYWSSDSLNQPVRGYSGATVDISDGLRMVTFTENPDGSGKYLADFPFRATADRSYTLTITAEGISDSASAYLTGVAPLNEINIQPEGEYYRYLEKPSPANYMLEIFYDWSLVPEYCALCGSCQAMEVFYELNTIDPAKTFAPDKEKIVFPKKSLIIRRKYSLTKEHQEYARSLLLETEWRGGVFDTDAGNVPTNFKNGLRGWFAACMVVSDTTFFE